MKNECNSLISRRLAMPLKSTNQSCIELQDNVKEIFNKLTQARGYTVLSREQVLVSIYRPNRSV